MAETQTLKVDYDGDVRRLTLKLLAGDSPSNMMRTIHTLISNGFGFSEGDPLLDLKYKDEDGDLCTLVETTIEDFLENACANKPLKLLATKARAQNETVTTEGEQSCGLSPSHNSEAPPAAASNSEQPMVWEPAGDHGHWSKAGQSVGPWKLLMCLRSLRDADLMSTNMVGSMLLQFLPILAQRVHRKQEKLNHVGFTKRETLLPLLRRLSELIDMVEEAKSTKPMLEGFLSGASAYAFGDILALVLKTLAACKNRRAVSEAILAFAPYLCKSLPELFPGLFNDPFPRCLVAEHVGIRCDACSKEPILGPRFHCPETGIDLCGECFIEQGAEMAFQCFFVHPGAAWAFGKWWQSPENAMGNSKGNSTACNENACDEPTSDWGKDWWQKKVEAWTWHGKGKCKGKAKGKGKGKHQWWEHKGHGMEDSWDASWWTCKGKGGFPWAQPPFTPEHPRWGWGGWPSWSPCGDVSVDDAAAVATSDTFEDDQDGL